MYSDDPADGILLNYKKLLPVGKGEKGLRQSDAVFSHIKGATEMAESLRAAILDRTGSDRVSAVAFSGAPRSAEGSYMPCFLVGESYARCFSAAFGLAPYRVSHQDGHIMAAAYSAVRTEGIGYDSILSAPFISFHVSGGTFDVLYVTPSSRPDRVFDVRCIGGSLDASAGQIIDRVGVRLGFDFPCGSQIDRLALQFDGNVQRDKLSVKGCFCNMSGLENRAVKMISSGSSPEEISAYTLDFISRTIRHLTLSAKEELGDIPVVYAGGVMCSEYIRRSLLSLGLFARPEFSSDNAAGVAILAAELYRKNNT